MGNLNNELFNFFYEASRFALSFESANIFAMPPAAAYAMYICLHCSSKLSSSSSSSLTASCASLLSPHEICLGREEEYEETDLRGFLRGKLTQTNKKQKTTAFILFFGSPSLLLNNTNEERRCRVGNSRGAHLTRSALILPLTSVSNSVRMESSFERLSFPRPLRPGRRNSPPPLPPPPPRN